MKPLLIIMLMSMCFYMARAQSISKQVIGSSGTHISNGSNNINFTVGETIIGEINNNYLVSQGFWAELNNQETLSQQEVDTPVQDITVYPNPATSYLHIRFGEQSSEDYSYQIFDVTGKQVLDYVRVNEAFEVSRLDISNLSEGMYMLFVSDKNSNQTQSFKILKN